MLVTKDLGRAFLKKRPCPQYRVPLGPAERPYPPSPQEDFFQKGYSIPSLFSVLIILSMINESSFL